MMCSATILLHDQAQVSHIVAELAVFIEPQTAGGLRAMLS
jgi:hypothetical protein